MTTTIDNNQKVFLLTGDMGKTVFCNMHDIPAAFNSFEDKDAVKIYYFWNATRTHIGRKKLNEWFKANQINYKFL